MPGGWEIFFFQVGTTEPRQTTDHGKIVGPAVAVPLIALVTVAVCFYRSRRRREHRNMVKKHPGSRIRPFNLYSASQKTVNTTFEHVFSPYAALLDVDPDTLEISKYWVRSMGENVKYSIMLYKVHANEWDGDVRRKLHSWG